MDTLAADRHYKYIILGAGCAGLSLCHALLARGISDPILILDHKAAFTDDRTWCFWNVRPNPFSSLISECWHRWDVRDTEGNLAAQASPTIGYACLRGQDFYTHVQNVLHRHPNVTLQLNHPAEACLPDALGVRVCTPGQQFDAEYVFDSRLRQPSGRGPAFQQRFFGQFVRTEKPLFDTSRCTLMDFQVTQERGLHFVYTLPFSPTEALVENTYIQRSGSAPVTTGQHRAEIAAYLADRTPFTVLREEAGTIPMTTRAFSRRNGRLFFIGTAGGCTKPSSGYTFARIQEQCRHIADAALSGSLSHYQEPLPSFRRHLLDTVFLQAMLDSPIAIPGYFRLLFSRVPPEALTAFLSETSSWRDDLKIIRSLPVGPFLRAAVRAAPNWLLPR